MKRFHIAAFFYSHYYLLISSLLVKQSEDRIMTDNLTLKPSNRFNMDSMEQSHTQGLQLLKDGPLSIASSHRTFVRPTSSDNSFGYSIQEPPERSYSVLDSQVLKSLRDSIDRVCDESKTPIDFATGLGYVMGRANGQAVDFGSDLRFFLDESPKGETATSSGTLGGDQSGSNATAPATTKDKGGDDLRER